MVNLPFHKQREGKTQTSTNFTTSECIREGACGCWGERVGKGVRKGVHGGVPELDGSLIAAGCAGVLRFVRIAGRLQGVKESAVTVTCSSGWCWGAWQSCSSCTGHSSSGSQGDLLPPPAKFCQTGPLYLSCAPSSCCHGWVPECHQRQQRTTRTSAGGRPDVTASARS